MIHVSWVSNHTNVSPRERLQEAKRIRQKCRSERHLMGDDGYARYMQYADRVEELARVEAILHAELNTQMEAMRVQSEQRARELVRTQPLHYDAVRQKLFDSGYPDWQVDKLIQYASFIQARGWGAFFPEDADFLRQKYEGAGVDPLTIDFKLLGPGTGG